MIKLLILSVTLLFSFTSSSYKHFNKKYLIIGAGPGGLFASWKILQQNPAAQVLLAEKRYDHNPEIDELDENQKWLQRKQVVQCHGQYFTDEETGFEECFYEKKCENCKVNRLLDTEFGRQTIFEHLDHFSLRNIQSTLYKKLTNTENIKNRFSFGKCDIRAVNKDTKKVEMTVSSNSKSSDSWFSLKDPFTLVDATGTGSHIMGKLVGYVMDKPNHFGAAVKFIMNDHFVNNEIDRMFHDCHINTHFKGDSSYHCFDHFNNLWKYLETTEIEEHKKFYSEMDNLFKRNMFSGIPVTQIITKMEEHNLFDNHLSFKFAWRLLENVINMNEIDLTNHSAIMKLLNFHSQNGDLEKVNMIYIRNREENWLKKNFIETTVNLNQQTFLNVQTIAIGDALTWTDWATGLGINRSFKSAEEIFVNHVDPNDYLESLIHTYAPESCDYRGLIADLGRAWVLPKKVIMSEEFENIMEQLYNVHFDQLKNTQRTQEIFDEVNNDLEKRKNNASNSQEHHLRFFEIAISTFQKSHTPSTNTSDLIEDDLSIDINDESHEIEDKF